MRNRVARLGQLAVVLLICSLAFAEGTQIWRQTKFDEFEKGTAKGVAIRSDGALELAPSFKQLVTTPSTYIWSITSDAQGNIYAAAGAPARVYRITPEGRASVIFEPQELQVQALLADGHGGLYAATSPDGKVYRIEQKTAVPVRNSGSKKKGSAGDEQAPEPQKPAEAPASTPAVEQEAKPSPESTPVDPSYTSSIYFDPKTKYIWDLALDAEGRLYVATGDHGEIYRVEKNGQGSVFFKSDEAHIRAIEFDPKGNLIAGSDGSGLVYRISPLGEAFVLYSTPKKEITAIAIDHSGNIYAAGVGEKRQSQAATAPTPPVSISPAPTTSPTGSSPASISFSLGTASSTGGSEVYKITPEGAPERLWTSQTDLVYALSFDSRGRLLAGTGNRGRIYMIGTNDNFTDLLKVSANQVIGFAKAPSGGLYVATSNLGKIGVLGPGPNADGSYESDVFDAKIFSKWGRAEVRGAGSFELYARSGNVDNPDRNWSPWNKVNMQKDAPVGVPMARFIQWRAVLHPGATPPTIEDLAINYRPNNVPPDIDEVAVQVGAHFNAMPRVSADNASVSIGGSSSAATQPKIDISPPATHDRDSIAVKWSAHDDNDDDLIFSIYYRGDGETRWKLLKDKITDKFYSWDAGLLPDGGYTVRVVASDSPSHSPDESLSSERESSRFEVDHTPPAVADLVVRDEGGTMHITFRGIDGFSPIKRAEYSVDANDWQFVEPVGELSDSKLENYDFAIPIPSMKSSGEVAPPSRGGDHGGNDGNAAATSAAEHVIVVRVYDRYDNMGTAKVVVRGPQ
jgi:hypothetical protein